MFNKVKEIRSRSGVLHFQRWNIFTVKNFFSVYLHIIHKADEDKHLHNHPWSFISLVLWGRYIERLEDKLVNRYPLQVSYRRKNVFHKIHMLLSKKVITLNIMFSKQNNWGYKVNHSYVDNFDYRNLKNLGSIDTSVTNVKVRCIKSLYKSTYESNAFDFNKPYLIESENDKFYYVVDNCGRAFSFSKLDTNEYYKFDDYFSKL